MTQGVAGYPSGVSAETNQGCPGLIKSVRNKSLLSCLCVTQKTSVDRGIDGSLPRRQVHTEMILEFPSDADIDRAVQAVLHDADLNSITKREIRRKLEDHFGVDLSSRKATINAAIDRGLLSHA